MKILINSLLVASVLVLSSASVFADGEARARKVSYTPENSAAQVEVVALNDEQVARLLSERKRHQEALAQLKAEHERTIDSILAAR